MKCSEGDGRLVLARGLCEAHYRRQYRGAVTEGPIRHRHGAVVTSDDVLACVKHLMRDFGQSPTHQELSTCVGLSVSRVHYWLHKLAEEGSITMRQGKPRSIQLTEGNHGKNR